MGKKSGGGGPQEVQQTTTNLPEYARPYVEEVLGRGVYESGRPYVAYPGQRIAEFDPYEQTAMSGMSDMYAAGTPQDTLSASQIATDVGQNYLPSQVYSSYIANPVSSGYAAGDVSNLFQAGQRGVGYQPREFDAGYAPGTMDVGYGATGYQSGYQAGQFDPGYQAGDLARQYTGPTFEAGTSADPSTIQDYMNPYTQLVTDIQKREARKQSDISGANIAQQAAQAGGL